METRLRFCNLTGFKGKFFITFIFIALIVLIRLFVTQLIPNPFIPGGTFSLEMVLPVIAGILFGPWIGLSTGLFGPAITWAAISFIPVSFDRSFLLCSIIPLSAAGFLSGKLAKRYSIFISSLPIAFVPVLSIVLFYLFCGHEGWTPFTESVAFGLAGEAMIDILIIYLVCQLWLSPKEAIRRRLGKRGSILSAIGIIAFLSLTLAFTVHWSPDKGTDYLFFCYFAILLSVISFGTVPGLIVALISCFQAISISLNPLIAEVKDTVFLHALLFGVMVLICSELIKARDKSTELEFERELLEEREQFMRLLAHELKTPLTAIISSVGLLAEEIKDKMLSRLVFNINRSAQDIDKRLSDLLDAARTEAKDFELKFESLEPRKLLEGLVASAQPLFMAKEQELQVELPPLPNIMGDKRRLSQAVFNILHNANKFTPPGGTITLRAREDSENIIIEIEDTGPGIAKEEMNKLFTPYFRAKPSDGVPGFGLGLFLARRIIELHKGKIWVRSELGKGSTFFISLPLRVNHEGNSY